MDQFTPGQGVKIQQAWEMYRHKFGYSELFSVAEDGYSCVGGPSAKPTSVKPTTAKPTAKQTSKPTSKPTSRKPTSKPVMIPTKKPTKKPVLKN